MLQNECSRSNISIIIILSSSVMANMIPTETWDQAIHQLHENSGVALVDLPQEEDDVVVAEIIPRRAFRVAQKTLDSIHNASASADDDDNKNSNTVQEIPEQADSAHVTGYHPAASANSLSSRYNQYREGFVWSDGEKIVWRDDDDDDDHHHDEFTQATDDLEALLHAIAEQILHGLERYLELSEGWFEDNLGPTIQNSQWHLKRYVVPYNISDKPINKNQKDEFCNWLPPHTDPSLISVVIHDRPGKSEGSQGLEYFHKSINGSCCQWKSVPFSGHKVAVIFVGSVLAYITGGLFPACKHRVVTTSSSSSSTVLEEEDYYRTHARMAATLFVRPRGTALVQVPPSPCLENVRIKQRQQIKTFDAWYARVARNYEKAKLRDPQS